MKGYKYILFLILAIAYIVVISGFISGKRKEMTVKELVVSVKNENKLGLLDKKDIEALILKNVKIKGKSIKEINLKEIENLVKKNNSVKYADTYITEDGILHVLVIHRIPVIRICDKDRRNFYLDEEGNIIPLSKHISPLVVFANGNINLPNASLKNKNIYIEGEANQNTIHHLLEIAKYIKNHDFWNSQIVQIYINQKHEFELIPRVGAHIILLGNINNYQEKLENLKLLYERFNETGWNDYVHINLKYKDQIICTKR